MSSIQTTRKTRSTTVSVLPSPTDEPAQLDDLRKCLQSPIQFISLYNQCYPLSNHRSALIDTLCHILADSTHVDAQILLFILDSLTSSAESLLSDLSDLQFKQDLLPFIKQSLATADDDANEIILSSLRFLTALIEHRSSLLTSTLAEWLSTILHFVVTRISTSSYEIYGDATIDLLRQVAKQFTPLPKEIVDVLGRSPSSIISTNFLSQLKDWVKHVEDARLALFAIHLWEPLAALLSRLLTRGHTKGNEMLAVMQDGRLLSIERAAQLAVLSSSFRRGQLRHSRCGLLGLVVVHVAHLSIRFQHDSGRSASAATVQSSVEIVSHALPSRQHIEE